MSRSNYDDTPDYDWQWIRWRGAVASAIKGRRGQAFLREMVDVLESMPDKRLASGVFEEEEDGTVCALGAVARARGIDTHAWMGRLGVAASDLGIASALAAEIVHENDDPVLHRSDADRYGAMLRWARVRLAGAAQ